MIQLILYFKFSILYIMIIICIYYIYMRKYLCIYLYICVYVCIYICVYVCIYIYMSVCMCIYICICCIYIHIYLFICCPPRPTFCRANMPLTSIFLVLKLSLAVTVQQENAFSVGMGGCRQRHAPSPMAAAAQQRSSKDDSSRKVP